MAPPDGKGTRREEEERAGDSDEGDLALQNLRGRPAARSDTLAERVERMSSGGPPVEIRRIRADEGLRLRAVRLRALGEAPLAFGSTLAREQAFPESVWHERAADGASGSDRATFIAEEAARWVGLATGVARHPDGPDHSPLLIGMFVDSTQRGRGVGAALVERVTQWARTLAAEHLYLWATSTNRPAIALYEKCGFRQTEEMRPLQHTASLREVLMVRSLR
jgi:GNAT superfamily N-acetyltransferase